jgi:hypothetical protein
MTKINPKKIARLTSAATKASEIMPRGKPMLTMPKKININDYIDELEDAGIYFQQNVPIIKSNILNGKTDPYPLLQAQYQKAQDFLATKPKHLFTNKKALDMWINCKEDYLYDDWGLQSNLRYLNGNEYFMPQFSFGTKRAADMINWDNYVKSMDRRRHDYFWSGMQNIDRTSYGIVDPLATRPSALYGFQNEDGAFYVSHFAPSDLKSGLRLINLAATDPNPVIFAVTQDLTPMLSRSGFTKLSETYQPFNGELHKKDVLGNNSISLEWAKDRFAECPGEYRQKALDEIKQAAQGKLFEFKGKHYLGEQPWMKNTTILK